MTLKHHWGKRLLTAGCLWALLFSGLLHPLSATVHAQEKTVAAELNDRVDAVITGGGASSVTLLDGRYSTYIDFVDDGEITFTSPDGEPIGAVYVVWQTPPEQWILETGSATYMQGQYGFLHDTVKLETPSQQVVMRWEADMAQLCDVYLFGEGELPDWVQQWQPAQGPADLLLLPTHADDEHLYFGGTMPYYADRGDVVIQVAYMVNHNGEPYRLHEQLNGLWTAGVTRYPVISSFPDVYSESMEHAETVYDRQELLAYQTELIRRFQPLVVIGHDLNGEYGHGAHMLNADCLTEVIERTDDPTYFPESYEAYGGWKISKLYLHLYEENPIVMDWGTMTLDSFGGKTALEVAQEAFACHTSQQQWFEVAASGPYDCRKFGLYATNVGLDEAENDFFEHVVLPRDAQVAPESSSSESIPEASESVSVSEEPSSSQKESTPVSVEEAQLPAADQPRIGLVYLAWGAAGISLFLLLVLLLIGKKKKR